MSPHTNASQNKLKLITIFLFTVLIVIAVQFIRPDQSESNGHTTNKTKMFMGLRHANAQEIHQILPETKGKLTLIEFHSRLCYDCQKMVPILDSLLPQYPQLHFRKFDILDDSKKYPGVFRTFKPVSVPIMIFISPDGDIRNVLYNYQPASAVVAAITSLEKSVAKKPATSKAGH